MMTMDQLRTIKQDTPKACLRNGVHINIYINSIYILSYPIRRYQ
jgi:hypothetical protein